MTVNQVTGFAEIAGRTWLKSNPWADFGPSSKRRKTRPHPGMIMFGLFLWPPCGFVWVFWLWQGLGLLSSICCAATDPEKLQKTKQLFHHEEHQGHEMISSSIFCSLSCDFVDEKRVKLTGRRIPY
jgi:hypothetical protein